MPTPLPPVSPNPEIIFPPEFKFGVADSDLQTIGEQHTLTEEQSEPTMWLRFTEDRGLETPAAGIDRFHRWQEDIQHMKRIGIQHYRTSVSMSRTLTRDGQVNNRGIDWYRRYFGALKKQGTSVYALLYHWELPQYLNEQGGWLNRHTALAFQRHAQVVAEQLGDLIDEYFILNEPWCSSMLSYYEGAHAPGNLYDSGAKNLRAAVVAAHHQLLAQGLAYEAIRDRAPEARISTVLNFQPSYTYSIAPDDIRAAQYRDGYFNTWFLNPIFMGRYPELMLDLYGDHALPPGHADDMKTIKIGDKLHALGVNYYKGGLYRAAGGELRSEEVRVAQGELNSLEWPIYEPPYYADGLYDILQEVYYGYRAFGLKRLYVSENGIALNTPWDGKSEIIDDERRIRF